jgi:hypothetical protein
VAQYEKQHKDLMDQETNDRRDKREDQRAITDERRADIAAAETRRREKADEEKARLGDKKLDAMIAGLIGKKNGEKSDLPERKFTDKQWSDAKKELTGNMFVTDDLSGKDVPDHAARAVASGAMRQIQSSDPKVDPVDAANVVGAVVSKVAAAAKADAKGDQAKYQKYLQAGVEMEINKALNGPNKPAPVATPAAPAAAPKAAPAVAPVQSNGDEYLRKATVAQLWAAFENPQTKQYALGELRRRGILPQEADAPVDTSRFDPA